MAKAIRRKGVRKEYTVIKIIVEGYTEASYIKSIIDKVNLK